MNIKYHYNKYTKETPNAIALLWLQTIMWVIGVLAELWMFHVAQWLLVPVVAVVAKKEARRNS